jgi:hypothetical protein
MNSRFAQLQSDCAWPLEIGITYSCIAGTEAIFEKILHSLFADRRTHGEWFKLTVEDLFFLYAKTPLSFRLHRDSIFDEDGGIIAAGYADMKYYPSFYRFATRER